MQTAENYTKTARKPLIFSGFRRIYKLRFLWLGYSFMWFIRVDNVTQVSPESVTHYHNYVI